MHSNKLTPLTQAQLHYLPYWFAILRDMFLDNLKFKIISLCFSRMSDKELRPILEVVQDKIYLLKPCIRLSRCKCLIGTKKYLKL